MKKVKMIVGIIISLIIVISLIRGFNLRKNWMIRFEEDLDRFFGKGNWECVNVESKETSEGFYKKRDSANNYKVPFDYKNWYISYKNNNGEEKIYKITNLSYEMNLDKHGSIGSKSMSKKQAFYSELMDISFYIIGDKILDEFVRTELSEKEASCITAEMSYTGGLLKPKFYSYLAKQDWFTADKVSAEHYLSCDEREFYIQIRAFDYKLKKLTEEERQNVFDSLEKIENQLLEKYGDMASFDIYFDKEHNVKYIQGRKK